MAENSENTWLKLTRDFNILKEGTQSERKTTIKKIYQIISKNKQLFKQTQYEHLMKSHLKTLLENTSNKSDFIREHSLKLIHKILPRCHRLHIYIPYIIQVLVYRTNSSNLTNDEHLPEIQKASPSQKPQKMVLYTEPVEEIRFQIVKIIKDIIECCEEETIIEFISEIVDILRALLMDGFRDVQIKTCEVVSEFVAEYKKYLVHFGTRLVRALLTPLVSKKGRVKKAALKSLGEILYIGSFKQSTEIMEILVGYRDPNYVPIKDFYESGFNVNYLALFVGDCNLSVREAFLNVLEDWVLNLPDREDHFSRIFPYLLSGLFDESDAISGLTVEILEELGKNTERDKEKKFREEKQLNIYPFWSYKGEIFELCKIKPFKKRVRIGTRFLFKNHMSKFITPVLRELKDSINDEFRLKSLKLLKYLIFISEDQICEKLDKIFPIFIRNLKIGSNLLIKKEIEEISFLLGRYNDFDILFKIFNNYYNLESENFKEVSFLFLNVFSGYFRSCPKNGLGFKLNNFEKFIDFFVDKKIINETKNDILMIFEMIKCIVNTFCNENERKKLLETKNNNLFRIFYYGEINLFYKNIKNSKISEIEEFIIKNFDTNKFNDDLKTNSDITFDSLDFKIILYNFIFEKNKNADFGKIIIKTIDINQMYYEEETLILYNLLKINKFVKNVLEDENLIVLFFNYIQKFLLNKKRVIIKNEKNLIFGLILRILDIMQIKKKFENLIIFSEFLENILLKLNLSFQRLKNVDKITLLSDFVKKIICRDFLIQKEYFKNFKKTLEIFFNKIFLIEEINQNYYKNFKIIKFGIDYILKKKNLKKEIKKEFFLIFFKIYLNIKNVNYKSEIFEKLRENLIKDKILLSEMIQTANEEQRLHRFNFLKNIWDRKIMV